MSKPAELTVEALEDAVTQMAEHYISEPADWLICAECFTDLRSLPDGTYEHPDNSCPVLQGK